MTKPTGGPAFPVSENLDERRGEVITYPSEGMTLRDYFAAKAMQGLMSSHEWVHHPDGTANIRTNGPHYPERRVAELAYRVADAMLAERDR